MKSTPIQDSLHFLIGDTPDHLALGAARWLLVALYAALLVGSVVIAGATYARDPAQRNARGVTIWLFRLFIGTMWFQASLWKLPLPVADGFKGWTEALVTGAAYPWHAAIVRDVLLPNISLLDPATYALETVIAVSLMLGIGVRYTAAVGVLFMVNLWLGLYRTDGEWPWNYVFAMMLHAFFSMDQAGRYLGLDGRRRGVRLG